MNISVETSNVQFLDGKRTSPTTLANHKTKDMTPKDLNNTFDFSGLSHQLPPNTGPAGTVPLNSSSNTNSNKNLSHVPCKFFRQGACQAGSSCPFSHNLDGTLAADKLPCKYFQKGNCKFGLKCALAHFLPDGTRVNSRNFTNSNSNGHNNHSRKRSISSTMNQYSAQPMDIGYDTSTSPIKNTNVFGGNHSKFDLNSQTNSTPLTLDLHTQNLNHGTNNNRSSTSGFGNTGYNGQNINYSAPNSAITPSTGSSTIGTFRSYSNNTSPITLTNNSSPQSNFFPNNNQFSNNNYGSSNNFNLQSSPTKSGAQNGTSISRSFHSRFPSSNNSFASFLDNSGNDSAIIDDDSKENGNEIFEEDYVPASLGDIILTPQELQRRDSRSQSGTLLSRPVIKKDDKNETENEDKDEKDEKSFLHEDVFVMD